MQITYSVNFRKDYNVSYGKIVTSF